MSEKVYLSWDDIKEACEALVDRLEEEGHISASKGLVVVLSGGMIPAYWVRKMIDVRFGKKLPIKTADLFSYAHDKQGAIEVLDLPDIGDGDGWIFVDEVVDTGATFKTLKEKFPKATYTAITAKPKGEEYSDLSILGFEQGEWIVFPWEIE